MLKNGFSHIKLEATHDIGYEDLAFSLKKKEGLVF
jgi:hypothetical protein